MTQFNPELYLRLAGERLLVDGRDADSPEHPLADAARALVAVNAIDADRAQGVVDDYGVALELRGQGHFHRHRSMRGAHASGGEPVALERRRIALCNRTIDHDGGTLQIRFVLLGEDSTTLAVVFRVAPSPHSRRRRGRIAMLGWHSSDPPDLTVTDDQGTTTTAEFSGGGSDQEWDGHYETETPLARDTAWIDVDGHRIDLMDEDHAVAVRVEQLPDEDPALAYLWRRVATPDHFHRPPESLETSIDALIAAGALRADEPALTHVRAALEATQHGPHPGAGGRSRLPEPWRSLVARAGREDGPVGTVAVGAVTPTFDGISVAILSVESNREAFEVEVEVAGDDARHSPFDSSVEHTTLTWWAADDHGNHYLGQPGSWSSGDGHGQGTIGYWPPIDPRATRLDLMPTTPSMRAVISVPLVWAARPIFPGGTG
jgi:hypothetical protein